MRVIRVKLNPEIQKQIILILILSSYLNFKSLSQTTLDLTCLEYQ